VDCEIAPAGPGSAAAGTIVILRQLIGLGALSLSTVVPLLAARAVLGVIFRFLLESAAKD
jgi:hypothetical protein